MFLSRAGDCTVLPFMYNRKLAVFSLNPPPAYDNPECLHLLASENLLLGRTNPGSAKKKIVHDGT